MLFHQKVRIFVFLPQLPYPPRSGGRIVTAPLVEGLAKNHEVHLFALTHGFEGEIEGAAELARKVASVVTAPAKKKLDIRPLTTAFFSDLPYKVHRFWNTELMRKSSRLAETHPPDAVHCQNFYTARYGREIPSTRKVLYKENFETRVLSRWKKNSSNPFLKGLIRIEGNRTLRFELKCASWFDEIACISKQDEKLFRQAAKEEEKTERHLDEHLRTIRPGIDLDFYNPERMGEAPNPFPDNDRKNLLVTGSFNYLANSDGSVWMAKEVFPRLPGDRFSLWFVGQRPGPEVRELHDPPRIHVTGSVPDVRPYFKYADLSVVPLRIGGGIRLKILESLAMGCPLVSTSVGCEGICGETESPVWRIADKPEDLARAIEETGSKPRDSESLRKWVRERFSPERFVSEMEALYCG